MTDENLAARKATSLAEFDAESQDIYVRGVLALIPSHWLVTYRSGLVSALRAAATALESANVQ